MKLDRTFLIRVGLLIVLVAGAAIPSMVDAQDEAPADEAAGLLPDAGAFGEGWVEIRASGLEVEPEVFRAGAVAVVGGPAGSRIVAVALLVTQDRVAVRRSWEAAIDIYDNYSGELAYLSGRDDELDTEPPPDGCVEARRIDGTARQLGIDTSFPMGITLCAADPDMIVLAVVSGTVFALSGYQASHAVASLMLAGRHEATPVSPAS